jgi:Rps23 Pro-64 3,4-dihydroxylase Tpa1-like proline 4-hydroxylase
MASNKLAVCLGHGSSYDKHFDSSGSNDLRKLTVLYYMNNNWTPGLGGQFRIHHLASTTSTTIPQTPQTYNIAAAASVVTEINTDDDSRHAQYTDIEPRGDRLLVFWSDRLEHSVLPSFTPQGSVDNRYALTVWIATEDASSVHL